MYAKATGAYTLTGNIKGATGAQGAAGDPATNLISSVFGRTGTISAAEGDYSASQIDFTPVTSGNWNTIPDNAADALDSLGNRVKIIETGISYTPAFAAQDLDSPGSGATFLDSTTGRYWIAEWSSTHTDFNIEANNTLYLKFANTTQDSYTSWNGPRISTTITPDLLGHNKIVLTCRVRMVTPANADWSRALIGTLGTMPNTTTQRQLVFGSVASNSYGSSPRVYGATGTSSSLSQLGTTSVPTTNWQAADASAAANLTGMFIRLSIHLDGHYTFEYNDGGSGWVDSGSIGYLLGFLPQTVFVGFSHSNTGGAATYVEIFIDNISITSS